MLYLILLSCKKDDLKLTPSEPLNLTEALGEEDVRAGVITDASALFGGASAEGQIGDIKLYNNRVPMSMYIDYQGKVYVMAHGGGDKLSS